MCHYVRAYFGYWNKMQTIVQKSHQNYGKYHLRNARGATGKHRQKHYGNRWKDELRRSVTARNVFKTQLLVR